MAMLPETRSADAAPLTIGFDIGGTNTRAGVVTAAGEIIDSRSIETPHDADELTASITRLVAEVRRDHDIAAVGAAIAGFLDPACEKVRFAPHLPWRNDAPVKAILEASIGLPVRLEDGLDAVSYTHLRAHET